MVDETQKPKKTEDLEGQLKRALADYDNLKKRFEKERGRVVKFANEALLLNLIGVVEGLEMTLGQFQAILSSAGFEKIKVEDGDKFNNKTMEAIDGEGETVEEALSSGYKLHEKVVRPARVRVKS